MKSSHKYVRNLDEESILNIKLDDLVEIRDRLLMMQQKVGILLNTVESDINILNQN